MDKLSVSAVLKAAFVLPFVVIIVAFLLLRGAYGMICEHYGLVSHEEDDW